MQMTSSLCPAPAVGDRSTYDDVMCTSSGDVCWLLDDGFQSLLAMTSSPPTSFVFSAPPGGANIVGDEMPSDVMEWLSRYVVPSDYVAFTDACSSGAAVMTSQQPDATSEDTMSCENDSRLDDLLPELLSAADVIDCCASISADTADLILNSQQQREQSSLSAPSLRASDVTSAVLSTGSSCSMLQQKFLQLSAPSPTSNSAVSSSSDSDEDYYSHSVDRSKSSVHLWQFLKELLMCPDVYHGAIRWIDQQQGIFKIENSTVVAKLWGRRKNRPAMNYDKLSRSIRQYYRKGIIRKTDCSRRLVYQFCPQYI